MESMTNMTQSKIFVSIVGLLETELVPTIKDLLSKAAHPERLHLSVVSQHYLNQFEEILKLTQRYNAELSYKHLSLWEVRGTGLARSLAQEPLDYQHEFFLQIDAHTRAQKEWDNVLVEWYNKEGWSVDYRFIYSTYPETYGYISDLPPETNIDELETDEDKIIYYQKIVPGSLPSGAEFREMIRMKYEDDQLNNYVIERIPWNPDMDARNHQYFCAGFAFGRAEYFIDVPQDPGYSYTGEEIARSIRFFAANTKIIEPYINPFYHDYEGNLFGRRPSWFVNGDKDYFAHEKAQIPFMEYEEKSRERLSKFMKDELNDSYSVNHKLIDNFYDKYVYKY